MMTHRPSRAVLATATAAAVTAAAGAGAVSCGQPLLSGPSYERPLIAIAGVIPGLPAPDLSAPRIGVVWVDPAQLRGDILFPPDATRFELTGTSFRLDLFTPPPAGAVRSYPDPSGAGIATSFALGEIVLYDDRDGDGTFRVLPREAGSAIVEPDTYRGAAESFVLLYVEQALVDLKSFQNIGPALAAPTGYRLANIGCDPADTPFVRPVTGPAATTRVATLGSASSDLPFIRICWRSHPTPGPAGP